MGINYRKKPVVIQAIQWTGDNLEEVLSLGTTREVTMVNDQLSIATLEGDHLAIKGDFIIKGVQGELYPCKPDIFEATYEKVEEN
jgi:hypothetical protein